MLSSLYCHGKLTNCEQTEILQRPRVIFLQGTDKLFSKETSKGQREEKKRLALPRVFLVTEGILSKLSDGIAHSFFKSTLDNSDHRLYSYAPDSVFISAAHLFHDSSCGKNRVSDHRWKWFYTHKLADEPGESSNDMHPFSETANFILGGFNNHVAHHLFPHYHHIHYPKLNKILYEILLQNNITPNQTTYWGGIVAHINLLKVRSLKDE